MLESTAGRRFSLVDLEGADLRLCLASCPGLRVEAGRRRMSVALLEADVARMAAAGATAALSCLTEAELPLGAPAHAAAFARAGIARAVLPIPDMTPPGPELDAEIARRFADLRRRMASGGRVAIHCMAGLGRTGTIAARLAMTYGLDADAAIAFIRARHDPGAIETAEQEEHLRALNPARAAFAAEAAARAAPAHPAPSRRDDAPAA